MIFYVACYTAPDGIYRCIHEHPTLRDAMNCLVPDGGSFIRVFDDGVFRSLNNPELIEFVELLEEMPWSFRYKAKKAAALSAAAEARKRAASEAGLDKRKHPSPYLF